MKFKNDLEMWHQFREFAKLLRQVAEFQEHQLAHECVDYAFDSGASEEMCSNSDITRATDFDSSEECWKCPSYTKHLPRKTSRR